MLEDRCYIMKTQICKFDTEAGALEVVSVEIKTPFIRSYNSAMQMHSVGEVNNELSLFVPNQALELSEIIQRSALGMEIPIVTREGVYISKSIDDEIDVLDKMDKDLTDYTKALLRYRHDQEQLRKQNEEKNKKKDELYNEWVKSLQIKQDKPTQAPSSATPTPNAE